MSVEELSSMVTFSVVHGTINASISSALFFFLVTIYPLVNFDYLFSHSLESLQSQSLKRSFNMHFSYIAAGILASLPSTANGYIAARTKPTGMVGKTHWSNNTETAWVTQTVTAYKTYCPSATTFTKGTKTYTATQQTWVTVTHCPNKCVISYQPGKPSIVPIGPPPKPAPAKNDTAPAKA
jgi:hypothetical protein